MTYNGLDIRIYERIMFYVVEFLPQLSNNMDFVLCSTLSELVCRQVPLSTGLHPALLLFNSFGVCGAFCQAVVRYNFCIKKNVNLPTLITKTGQISR